MDVKAKNYIAISTLLYFITQYLGPYYPIYLIDQGISLYTLSIFRSIQLISNTFSRLLIGFISYKHNKLLLISLGILLNALGFSLLLVYPSLFSFILIGTGDALISLYLFVYIGEAEIKERDKAFHLSRVFSSIAGVLAGMVGSFVSSPLTIILSASIVLYLTSLTLTLYSRNQEEIINTYNTINILNIEKLRKNIFSIFSRNVILYIFINILIYFSFNYFIYTWPIFMKNLGFHEKDLGLFLSIMIIILNLGTLFSYKINLDTKNKLYIAFSILAISFILIVNGIFIGVLFFEFAWGIISPNLNLLASIIIRSDYMLPILSISSFIYNSVISLLLLLLGSSNSLILPYFISFIFSLVSIVCLIFIK